MAKSRSTGQTLCKATPTDEDTLFLFLCSFTRHWLSTRNNRHNLSFWSCYLCLWAGFARSSAPVFPPHAEFSKSGVALGCRECRGRHLGSDAEGRPPSRKGSGSPCQAPPSPRGEVGGAPPTPAPLQLRPGCTLDNEQRGTSLGTAPHHRRAVLISAPGLCPRSLHPKGPEGKDVAKHSVFPSRSVVPRQSLLFQGLGASGTGTARLVNELSKRALRAR